MNNAPTTGYALAELLLALGFDAMADDCRNETNRETLCRYARIILRNAERAGWDYSRRLRMATLFRNLGVA